MKYTTITLNNALAVKNGIQNIWKEKGAIIIYPKFKNMICFIENNARNFNNAFSLENGYFLIEASNYDNYIDFKQEVDKALESK